MIFELTPAIRNFSEGALHKLSKLILEACDKDNFIDIGFQEEQWLNNKLCSDNHFYSELDREIYAECSMNWMPTGAIRNCLGQPFAIQSEEDLKLMEFFITESSRLYLENEVNDMAVIKKWVKLYNSSRLKSTASELVGEAIEKNRLREWNLGGKNGIPNLFDNLIKKEGNEFLRKASTVFDSDKVLPPDVEAKYGREDKGKKKKNKPYDPEPNKVLKEYLDAHNITYHELEKREMEIYFPVSCFRKAKCLKDEPPVINNPIYWDFTDMEKENFTDYRKNQLSELAKVLTIEELKSRLEHIKTKPDEITQIFQKIAGPL